MRLIASPNSGATVSTCILAICCSLAKRNRVGDHDFVHGRCFQALDRRPAEHSVSRRHVDLFSTFLVYQLGRSANRTGRADHIVENNCRTTDDRSAN